MSISVSEFERYIDICTESETNKVENELQEKIATLQKEKKSAKKELGRLTHETDAEVEAVINAQINASLGAKEQQEQKNMERALAENEELLSVLTYEQRKLPQIMKENMDFAVSFDKYREQQAQDTRELRKMFPYHDVDGIIADSVSRVGSGGFPLDEFKMMTPPEPIVSDGTVYKGIGFFTGMRYAFLPMTYRKAIPEKAKINKMAGINYVVFFLLLLLWNMGRLPLIMLIIGLILLWSMCGSYINNATHTGPEKFLTREWCLMRHFTMYSQKIMKEHVFKALDIPTETVEQLALKCDSSYISPEEKKAHAEIEEWEKALEEEKVRIAKYEESLKKLRQKDSEIILGESLEYAHDEEKEYYVKQIKKKCEGDFLNRYKNLHEEMKEMAEQRKDKAEKRVANAKIYLESCTAGKSDTKKKMEHKLKVRKAAELLLANAFDADDAMREKLAKRQAELDAKRRSMRENMSAEKKKQIEKLEKQIADIDQSIAEEKACLAEREKEIQKLIEGNKDFIRRLADNIVDPSETKNVLSPVTFVQSTKEGPYGTYLSKFVHNKRPSIMLYSLDGTKTDATSQVSLLLEKLIESFYTTNSVVSVSPQTIIDTITGAKKFKNPDYASLINVLEHGQEINNFVKKLDGLAEQIVASGSKDLDELNMRRYDAGGMAVANHVTYFILPSDMAGASRIMSDELWKLIRGGSSYGFLPVFFIEKGEWEKFEAGEGWGMEFYEKLSQVVESEQIYDADIATAMITVHKKAV